eukprot:COSAG06_NODE_4569_length_4139_cov_2.100248_5_plen_69_part_00
MLGKHALKRCLHCRVCEHPLCQGLIEVMVSTAALCVATGGDSCTKTALFLSFSYVCPEPVLVKCSFLV